MSGIWLINEYQAMSGPLAGGDTHPQTRTQTKMMTTVVGCALSV